jgi:O-acetyl-ADP-ribose deacetylase (regulator of RNase III)
MIHFVRGDATLPRGDDPKIIVHCCNDVGAWGAGFVLALSERWPFAEEAYRHWVTGQPAPEAWLARVDATGPFALGEVQLALIGPKMWVANLVGQHGVGMGPGNRPPIRYDAIQNGLKKVARYAKIHGASIHMPRMGAGLAGGRWDAIEKLVKAELSLQGIAVTVYDL